MIESLNQNNTNKQGADKTLGFIQDCPVCDKQFEMDGVEILKQKDNASLVHITCTKCLSSVLAVVLMTEMGTSSIGILTDLEPQDVLKQKQTISHDHVLDLHLLLQQQKEFESAILSNAKSD